jgi:hypothetical protein
MVFVSFPLSNWIAGRRVKHPLFLFIAAAQQFLDARQTSPNPKSLYPYGIILLNQLPNVFSKEYCLEIKFKKISANTTIKIKIMAPLAKSLTMFLKIRRTIIKIKIAAAMTNTYHNPSVIGKPNKVDGNRIAPSLLSFPCVLVNYSKEWEGIDKIYSSFKFLPRSRLSYSRESIYNLLR